MKPDAEQAEQNCKQLFAEFVAVMEKGAALKQSYNQLKVEKLSIDRLYRKAQQEIEELESELECGGGEGEDDYDLGSYFSNVPPIHREDVLEAINSIAFEIGAIKLLELLNAQIK